MRKIILTVLTAAAVFSGEIFAGGLREERPYSPPAPQKYRLLKKYFPALTEKEIKKSANISRRPEFTDLINDILVYLRYKKLIKQTKILPPIFLLYSDNNSALTFAGGLYYDSGNIIILNANNFYTGGIIANDLSENERAALDFVTFAAIIGHELMHYEDLVNKSELQQLDGAALNEFNAYKRSEKIIEYFLKMPKAEADEIIPVENFYESVRKFEDYFNDIRKNYIKIVKAAGIFLKNEQKICATLGLDKDKFKMLTFFPAIVFNAKNGGHIIKVESGFLDLKYRLLFEINIISGSVKALNAPKEIEAFKKEAREIILVNKKSYVRTRLGR